MNAPGINKPDPASRTSERRDYLVAVSWATPGQPTAAHDPQMERAVRNLAVQILSRFMQHRLHAAALSAGPVGAAGSLFDGLLTIKTPTPSSALPVILDTLGEAMTLMARVAWFDDRELIWRQLFPEPGVFRCVPPIDEARIDRLTGGQSSSGFTSPAP